MRTIGTAQLLAMKFERMPLNERWFGLLGRLPHAGFMICVYGDSGEGKTELCVQMAKEFLRFDRAEWVGFETSHDPDMQDAALRNSLDGLGIVWTNPWSEKAKKRTLPAMDYPRHRNPMVNEMFEELAGRILRKKSAKYWFFDSENASQFTEHQWMWLWKKAGKNKGFIVLSHAKGRGPKSAAGKAIEFYGQIGIYVKNYLAFPDKNRFGGKTPFVIWEEAARDRNPLFFASASLGDRGGKNSLAKTKKSKKK